MVEQGRKENGVANMKKCKWSVLKRQNDGKQLNLEIEDQLYIDKVIRYLNSHRNGMMETEIVRKDLIGLAAEAKEEGKSLEVKLGSVKEFGETLAFAGKEEKQKERLYYFFWQLGWAYLCVPIFMLAVYGIWKLITIVLGFEFQFENIRFNLPFSLCYLILPPLFSIYEVFFKYYFILSGKIGKVLGVVETGLPFLLLFGMSYLVRSNFNFNQLPGGNIYVPNAFWILFEALIAVIYIYGRYKFFESAEKTAEKYHLEM